MTVWYELVGEIGVVTIDQPPVNALGADVRRQLASALERACSAARVHAVVLAGRGRGFSAGADIRELGVQPSSPTLADVIRMLETANKPVVAAIHGHVLGGGLELALGCAHRIASTDATLALPEVKLGLMPGAGGTQRLPRLIGVEAALRMILTGEAITASEAATSGLVDEVASGDVIAAGVAYAKRVVAARTTPRRIASAKARPPTNDVFETAEADARKRGMEAPLKCITAVRASTELELDAGLALESRLFTELRDSAQSKALRRVFTAERDVAKVSSSGAAARPVTRVAILGAGTMGAGIAMCFANAGLSVALIDAAAAALDRGAATIRKTYASALQKGRVTQEEHDARIARIATSTSDDALADADLIIEAVFEDMAVKQQIFAKLGTVARRGAVLATNTSTLDIDAIASASGRPGDVVGMHFFSPAHVMRLVEVVRGRDTHPEVIATAMATARQLGKVGVSVGNCPGFVANRMLLRRSAEAVRLVEEGASPEQVDRVLVEFGMPMGPFAMADLAGLDVGWRIREERRRSGDAEAPPHSWLDVLAEQGRHGQKTRAGVYRYDDDARRPQPDPFVAELVHAERTRKGIAAREVSDEEILKRCMSVVVNEGARILEEGIVTRATEIDVIWIHAYGFPKWRGGPMYWADEEVGTRELRDYCAAMFQRTKDRAWRPAALLDRLARTGRRFDEGNAPSEPM